MAALDLLADELGVNQRTLRRVINDGTLRASRPSPRTVELSVGESRYARHAWTLISTLRRSLRTEHNVRFALLFGSAARGTDTASSDVDVLVVMGDGSVDRVVDLEAKLSTATGRRVDIVRLQDAERRPSFLADVIAEGRVLVDREGRWTRLRSRGARLAARLADGPDASAALAAVDAFLTRG
jgi:predicted nucleotidyltransferase